MNSRGPSDKARHHDTSKRRDPSVASTGEPDPDTVPEHGGPTGPEPTRYGDWEKKGRCIDF